MVQYEFPRKKIFFPFFNLTFIIIAINVFVFFILKILAAVYGDNFISSYLALTPSLILAGKNLWTLVTSIFVHANFFHLFANMFSLFFIGKVLERIIGKKRFFWVYIISGIVGGVFFVAGAYLMGDVSVPGVGASGAIFGLLGVLAVIVPFSRIYLIVGPLILIVVEVLLNGILPLGAMSVVSTILNIVFILMIVSMFSFGSFRKFSIPVELPMWLLPAVAIIPLVIIGFFVELPIANSAHFGGLVVGLIYGFYLRKKFPNKTKRISQMFAGR